MAFTFPPLPYSTCALEPHLHRECVDTHYNTITKSHFDAVNSLIISTAAKNCSTMQEALEVISRGTSHAELYHALLDAINHVFFWESISPNSLVGPSAELLKEIEITFGSMDQLKQKFIEVATKPSKAGVSFVWLVMSNGQLQLKNSLFVTPSVVCASTGKTFVPTPLLAIDCWEHAYNQQYATDCGAYVTAVWNLIDWERVNDRFSRII